MADVRLWPKWTYIVGSGLSPLLAIVLRLPNFLLQCNCACLLAGSIALVSLVDFNAAAQMHSLHDALGLQLSTHLSFCPCLFPLWSRSGSGNRHICGPWKLPRYSPAGESICE